MNLSGTYQAVVSNTTDPQERGRVRLQVPQVSGAATQSWARPAFDGTRVPAVGEDVWVFYEGGDPARAVYMPNPTAENFDDYDPIEPLVSTQVNPVTYLNVQTVYYLFGDNWADISLIVPPSGSIFISVSATVFPGKQLASQASVAWAIYDDDLKSYVYNQGVLGEVRRRGTKVGATSPGVNGTMMTRRYLAKGLTPGNRIRVRPMYLFTNSEASEYARISEGRLIVEPIPLSPYPPISTQQTRQPKYLNSSYANFPEDELADVQAVVPPSGKMFVSISGLLSPSSATVGDDIFYSWTASGTSGWTDNISHQVKQLVTTNFNAVCAGTRRTLLTGMTPGDVVRFRPVYGTDSALSSTTFTATAGQFIVEPVIDAPDLPVQQSTQKAAPILLGGSNWVDFTEPQWAPITTKVPPTGNLLVSISASMWSSESDTSELRIGWKVTGDYGWSGDGIVQALMTKGKTWSACGTKRHLLEGLTPGSTVTITPQYWCSANSTSGSTQTNTVSGGQLAVEPVRAGNAARLAQQLASQENETAHFQVVANATVRDSFRPADGDAYVMSDSETILAKVNGKWLTVAEKRPYILVHKDSFAMTTTSDYFPWTSVLAQNDSGLYSPQDPDALYTTRDGIYEFNVNCRWSNNTTANRAWLQVGGKEFRVWSLETATSGAHGVSGTVIAALKSGSLIRLAMRAGANGTAVDIRMSVEYKGPCTSGKYDNV
ncbi:phage baseplate assembly protein V [Streptomyces sp. NPDC087850]|uniref:phage baseplate assembly protein V n=1 Tax=Streptomyces sp. NPDC087850 TaxID=3365809 RepID=UPI003812DAB9